MKFFRVKPRFFEVGKSYSFRLFIYDTQREQRIVGLHEKSYLTEEIFNQWSEYVEKGAYIQIHKADFELFFEECSKTLKDIKNENVNYYSALETYERRISTYKSIVDRSFKTKEAIKTASGNDSFKEIMNRVKAEILVLELNINPHISVCTEIVEKVFIKDILPVRVACLSYLIAKANKIKDMNMLCDIVVSSLLRDLGFSLIESSKFQKLHLLLVSKLYEKHPMLTIYLLSKTGFEFSVDCKRFILEHHESIDGRGFPRGKKESHIHLSSSIINLAEQIIQYKESKDEMTLIEVMRVFQKRTELKGVRYSMPEMLTESLISLIPIDE